MTARHCLRDYVSATDERARAFALNSIAIVPCSNVRSACTRVGASAVFVYPRPRDADISLLVLKSNVKSILATPDFRDPDAIRREGATFTAVGYGNTFLAPAGTAGDAGERRVRAVVPIACSGKDCRKLPVSDPELKKVLSAVRSDVICAAGALYPGDSGSGAYRPRRQRGEGCSAWPRRSSPRKAAARRSAPSPSWSAWRSTSP